MIAGSLSQVASSLTPEEWARLDEDEGGELVDGTLEADEMAGWAHEVVVAWLFAALSSWSRTHGARVIGSGLRLGVSPTRGRKADLVVYFAGAPRPQGQGLVRVPPSVVVEVVSASPADARRDRVQKADEYAAFGVAWYWIVDPQLRTIEVLELGADGRYARALGATSGSVRVAGCEELTLDLDALWRDLDEAVEPER